MPEKPYSGILSTIGNTPLVHMENLLPGFGSKVYAKLERFNPGGSIKDRSALRMLVDAVRSGELRPGESVVIESSSGNLAVGLAQVCRYFGLRFICVVDGKTTGQNLAVLNAFGAEVEVITERDTATGEYLPARLRRVRELVASTANAFWPNQYANPLNPRAHEVTMREIARSLDGRVDYLFASVSTFGTLKGCADHIHDEGLDTTVVAVDALGSAIFGLESTARLIPGHGASVVPPLMDPQAADDVVHISDLECVAACRRLVAREAILAGGSSGATVAALRKYADRIPDGSNCVLIFPDGGDRYLDTIYCDEWVRRNFGEVSHLWKD
ncbi:2,3-diaminopropionate biosynthesis protein SbnA [Streptomyces griseorubiginosus]|uniref:2,3-diaminopropionate biosynthesis protein SbnA n=1 Tax=Streptomyces griseorubiginosus TaxID=67304 RepID=UPI00114062B7|nr:2,3-diaminopropionate biosynthesis protein SbnA [Streptomyces griseorubiginosus]